MEKASKPSLEEHGRAGHGTEEEKGEDDPEVYSKYKEKHSQYRRDEAWDPRSVSPEHFVIPILKLVC